MWYNYAQNGESQFNAMSMIDAIQAKRENIYAIAKKHGVGKLWVFGSVARKEERPDSDVDFLVKFAPEASFKDFMGIEHGVSEMLGRSVDIVENTAIRRDPRFAWRVCPEAIAL